MWRFCKTLKTEIPCEPDLYCFGDLPENYLSYHRDDCSDVFIASLFTIPRKWNQPTCPSIDEWIVKIWHICTRKFYADVKENEFWTKMGRTENSPRHRETNNTCSFSYVGPGF